MRARWQPRVALVLVAVYLLIAIPVGVRKTFLLLRAAAKTVGEPVEALRPRIFGRGYVATVDEIRRVIPEDEPYLLSELDERDSRLWVRFDLLPRRAIFLRNGESPEEGFDCWLAQVRWEVVATGINRPPLLRERPVTVPPGCPPAPWRERQR